MSCLCKGESVPRSGAGIGKCDSICGMQNTKSLHLWRLFAALFLFLAGVYALLFTRSLLEPRFWFTALITLSGFALLFFVFLRSMQSKFMFFAVLLMLSGVLLTVSFMIPVPIQKFWPIFMIVFGIAVFCAGCYKTRIAYSNFLAVSVLFTSLGGFFCIFSFGYSSMRLRSFLFYWWPISFFIGGLLLFELYIISKAKSDRKKP